jgi:hypothetical protein
MRAWKKVPKSGINRHMKMITRLSILSVLMLFIGMFSTSASAYVTCSGCRVFGGYTVSGESADSYGGGYTIPGSSAYSVSGSDAYSTTGNRYDYCSRTYDPRYCYWQYASGRNAPDDSGADYYVLGGAVYK